MNEHNPMAFAISMLQEKWRNSVKNPDYKLVRWVIEKENVDIFKGFLKLESTPHGSLEETFIILFTPFESPYGFAYALSNDWLEMFEEGMQQGSLPLWGDFSVLKEQLKALSFDANYEGQDMKFFNGLLKRFKEYNGKKTKLVVGVMPYGTIGQKQYNQWLKAMLDILPDEVALMTIDFAGQENQTSLFDKDHPERISILATGLYDAGRIYKQLAITGHPDDPRMIFRTCMFEMGEAAKNDNKRALYHWGEKALMAAQGTGDKLFWASAHIVYAGFLFGFKDSDKIEKLIENGIQICEQLLVGETEKMATTGLLAQLFGYKAVYLDIQKKHKESIRYFEQQADILVENNQAVLALGAFQNALLVAGKHQSGKIQEIAEKGFAVGYSLKDELLRASGFPLIAYYYLQYGMADDQQKEDIGKRMAFLYTDEWERNAKKHLCVAPEAYVS